MTLVTQIQNHIKKESLIQNGDTLIVGVSGGADSICLMNILNELKHEFGLKLYIAHFNHNLRKSADTDENFVRKESKKINLPFITKKWEHSKKKSKGSLEESARKNRFNFLINIAKQKNANAICLAHNKDDLAETVLMRILRGTGLQGLRSILPKKEITGVNFIRPLLCSKRTEIENYLKGKKIKFRTDPSNKNTKFFRNKIRLELLPLLEKNYSPNIKELLAKLATNIAIDYEYLNNAFSKDLENFDLNKTAAKIIHLDLKRIKNLQKASQRNLFRKSIEKLKGDTNKLTLDHYKLFEDLLENKPSNKTINLPHNIKIIKVNGQIKISIGKNK